MKSYFSDNKSILSILISYEFRNLIKTTLFDANFNLIESGYWNERRFNLDNGIYLLRLNLNGEIRDKSIVLNKNLTAKVTLEDRSITPDIIHIQPPKQYSSALLGKNYASSFEYYSQPVEKWSHEFTTTSLKEYADADDNSSLFIFLRFPSVDRYKSLKQTFTKFHFFKIVDEGGEMVCDFENYKHTKRDEEYGWLAFNSSLNTGIYYLIYYGSEKRQIPIYVFRNWHTQFFLTIDEQPVYSSIRIFLNRYNGFNPENESYRYIDVLLNKLENKNYHLEENLIDYVASGKFEQPMLGIICAYIYLKNDQNRNDQLFRNMLKNIQNLILKDSEESPDIRALNILASKYFKNYKYKKTKVIGTPMIRIGFETILDYSVKHPKLISQNSINDLVSENLRYDSPFNTFVPIRFEKKKKRISSQGSYLKSTSMKKLKSEIDFAHREIEPDKSSKSSSVKYIRELYPAAMFESLKSEEEKFQENSWIQHSIKDYVTSKEQDITISDISSDLHISPSTVKRILNEWKKI